MTITESFKRLASKMLSKPVDQVKGDTISEVIDYTADNYGGNSGGLGTIPVYGMGQIVMSGKLYTINLITDTISVIHRDFLLSPGITRIMIPKEITNIDYQAFVGCPNLTDVYYEGNEVEWGAIAVDNTGNTSLINAAKHFNWDRNKPIPID